MLPKVSIVIPTYNAEHYLKPLLESIKMFHSDIIIIDSSSTDKTVDLAKEYTDKIIVIDKKDFRHGGSRNIAGKIANGDIIVYMTQDALVVDKNSIKNLVSVFCDEKIAAAYGRQLPYPNEKLFGQHLRYFNYGTISYRRKYQDKEKYGIKTAFLSDSFAAYRRKALEEIGWFKDDLNFGEDMHAGARFLKKGYHIAYVAEAKVYHSHSYTLKEEFLRYKATGVFHQQEAWLLEEFGKPEGEGLRFVKSELSFLWEHRAYTLLPFSIVRNFVKLLGYKYGKVLTQKKRESL